MTETVVEIPARPSDIVVDPSISLLRDRPAITLTWNKLSYAVAVPSARDPKSKEKEQRLLLDSVSGCVPPGSVVAIMGASGAGKTTLLNVLAGRIASGTVSGQVLVNGFPRVPSTWKSTVGYVEQDDIMYENLTVRETFMYAALLRLPRTMSRAEKEKRVDEIITELGLKKCENTIIGSPGLRGISGGERKRVSIGVELVTDPSLIFLDEPTSGLDAFTASNIVSAIKEIAVKKQRTVLMTIHQPREYILSLFDQILLLSNGKIVYSGPVPGATEHFAKCGFVCPANTNPADFFLDTMTIDLRSNELQKASLARVEILQKAWTQPALLNVVDRKELAAGAQSDRETWNNGPLYEIGILLKRNMQDVKRDKATMGATFGQAIVNTLILGFIFFQVDLSAAGIQNRLGVMFMLCIQLTFGNVMPTLAVFILQREIIKRERASGTYRALSAYLAKILAQIPLVWISTALFAVPVYWLIGMQATAAKYFTFLAIVFVHTTVATVLGITIGSGAPNVRVGQILAPMLIVVFLIFGGQVVNTESAPAALQWIKWISVIFYSYTALAQNEFAGLTFACPGNSPPGCQMTGDMVISQFALAPLPSLWYNVVIEACLGVVFVVAGYFLFAWRSKPMMKLS